MRFDGEASDADEGFVHQALIYGSDQEFLDVAAPFVEEAVEGGEPTLVAVQRRNVDGLRSAVGDSPPGVTLLSVEEWYDTSARTRDRFDRWVTAHTADGRVRLIGEPPWAIGDPARLRDWARQESVLNVAFADHPLTFICSYDARILPAEVIGHAHSTHPEVVNPEGAASSESYEEPLEFCSRLDSAITRPTGEPDEEIDLGVARLPALRRTVGEFAAAAGLTRSRADELVLAVHEIATNAIVHGRSPARVRVWHREGELVFEVSDAGTGIADALAGQLTPSRAGSSGRGIWLTRLACDAVEIRSDSGCAVLVHAATPTATATV